MKSNYSVSTNSLYTLENILISRIVAGSYQRKIREEKVSDIVAHFDEYIANEPKVSFRDGAYYVFDGQHTIAARKLLNKDVSDFYILCKVYHNMTAEDEARLFALQTGEATFPTSSDVLKAEILAQDKAAIDFKRVTEDEGVLVDMDNSYGDKHLHCISTARKQYFKLGEKTYRKALSIIKEAWEASQHSLRRDVFIGVCEFVRIYDGEFDEEVLVDLLEYTDPVSIYQNIVSDFSHKGIKRNVNQIYQIYTGGDESILPIKF